MPEERQPPVIHEVSLDAEPYKPGLREIQEAYALTLVRQTFWVYEWFRQQNHDRRWMAHDALYYGYVKPRNWEGTNIPRSALGMPITFDQIEAALPIISQNLFGFSDWFQVEAESGTDPAESRAVQMYIQACLERGKDESGMSARSELELAARSTCLYGNGGISIDWDETNKQPEVEWVDLRDIYVDPACPTANIDEARSVVRRRMLTVDELELMRGDSRLSIPETAVLNYMARNRNVVSADQTKQSQEALRGVQYNPVQHADTPLPNDKTIDVLIYYSKTKIIWVLNNQWVMYQGPNPYGFYPFCFAPCYPILGRFYAMSMADVLEGNQLYIQALMNARLDELHLAIIPPRVRKRSAAMTPAQQRWRPGAVMEAEDPKSDVVVQYPQNATANIANEIAYLEMGAEKRTGVNSLIASGMPRAGNANRTAAGMNAQVQGGSTRLMYIVRQLEDYLITPMLYKFVRLMQYHLQPQDVIEAIGPGGQAIRLGADVFRRPLRFRMLASSRMMTKEKLSQIVPFLAQYLLNGPLVAQMQKSGATIDWMEFFRMLQDSTGTARQYTLVRQLSPQEQQALNAPPPEAQLEMQKAQMEQQTRLQMGQMKVQGELQKEHLKKQPNPYEAQMEQMKAQMEMEFEKQKQELELRAMMIKAQLEEQIARQKMATEAQKAQQDMMVAAMKVRGQIQASQQQAQNDMMIQGMRHKQNMELSREERLQQMFQGAEQHDQNLEHSRRAGEQKLKFEKQRASMKSTEKKPSAKPVKKRPRPVSA